MGGLARAAGEGGLNQSRGGGPLWLIGGDAALRAFGDAPTVWLVDIDDPATRRRAAGVALTPGDLADAARYADAGQRLLRRRLIRLLLAAAGGYRADAVTIERDRDGAPIVATPQGWYLSVAARWPACAMGVDRSPLGIDIERVDREPLPLDLLSEAERQRPDDNARTMAARRWAAKEAHAKWTGRPLSLDPAAIDTSQPSLVTSRFGTTRCWLHDQPGYVTALCVA